MIVRGHKGVIELADQRNSPPQQSPEGWPILRWAPGWCWSS